MLAASLAACVAPPMGPLMPVAPGPGKPFDAFAGDDLACRHYAEAMVAPGVAAANRRGFDSVLIGSALGAGLGAAIGGGHGAAIGAAGGAAAGTTYGAVGANWAQMALQQQYDYSYAACMTAKGNRAPGFAPVPGAPPPPGR